MEDSVADEEEPTEKSESKGEKPKLIIFELEYTGDKKRKKRRKNLRVQFRVNHIYLS